MTGAAPAARSRPDGLSSAGVTPSRMLVAPLVALVVAVGALTGCSSSGNTSCALDGCTVTFPRTGQAEVSVLGVSARLVRVDADIAQVEVAGQTVQVPVGARTEVAGGLQVGVDRITDTEVVVRITRAA